MRNRIVDWVIQIKVVRLLEFVVSVNALMTAARIIVLAIVKRTRACVVRRARPLQVFGQSWQQIVFVFWAVDVFAKILLEMDHKHVVTRAWQTDSLNSIHVADDIFNWPTASTAVLSFCLCSSIRS